MEKSLAYNPDKLTITGKLGFITSMLLVFSISVENRIEFIGLLMHPYLIFLPLAILFSGISLFNISLRVLIPLLLFFVLIILSSLRNDDIFLEIFKVGAAVLTFLYFAKSVNSNTDFRWISRGFLACSVTIGILAFQMAENGEHVARLSGVNVMEGIANKNAQSLFTLPGLFFGVWLLWDAIGRRKLIQGMLISLSIFFIIVQTFLAANRSGWMGLLIIFLSYLIYSGARFKTVFISFLLLSFTYLAIEKYANDIFEYKRTQTLEGYSSDYLREELSQQSFIIGLENPLFGLGADNLHIQLALRLKLVSHGIDKIDTHFLFGYLIGSSGVVVLFLFLLFLKRLPERPQIRLSNPFLFNDLRKKRVLLIAFIVLFVVRSFFTREILYSPTFIGGLGLLYSYYQFGIRNARFFNAR